MIWWILVLAVIGIAFVSWMLKLYKDTRQYSFRNPRVYKKQSASRLLGAIGSLCLLIGIVLFVLFY